MDNKWEEWVEWILPKYSQCLWEEDLEVEWEALDDKDLLMENLKIKIISEDLTVVLDLLETLEILMTLAVLETWAVWEDLINLEKKPINLPIKNEQFFLMILMIIFNYFL
jgi:hypothetical protein